jgi:hypothetical protein
MFYRQNNPLNEINALASKMIAGLGCECYFLDMSKYGKDLKEYLQNRNMNKQLEEQINENSFILANKSDDVSHHLNTS